MSILQTTVDKSSAQYKENETAMSDLCHRFDFLHREAAMGGPAKARDKHVQRGKLLVRE